MAGGDANGLSKLTCRVPFPVSPRATLTLVAKTRDSESFKVDVPLVISCYVIVSSSPYAGPIYADSKRIKRPGLRGRKRKLN